MLTDGHLSYHQSLVLRMSLLMHHQGLASKALPNSIAAIREIIRKKAQKITAVMVNTSNTWRIVKFDTINTSEKILSQIIFIELSCFQEHFHSKYIFSQWPLRSPPKESKQLKLLHFLNLFLTFVSCADVHRRGNLYSLVD